MPPLGRLKLPAFLPFRNPLFTDVGVSKQRQMENTRHQNTAQINEDRLIKQWIKSINQNYI